jgi:putative transposase
MSRKSNDFVPIQSRLASSARQGATVGGMPRCARITAPGVYYPITARGNRRQPIYVRRGDHEQFLAYLDDAVSRFGWICLGYCLLTNHYHLLIHTPEDTISAGMHRLNGLYAQWFNDTHGVDGHLFQSRFYSDIVETEAHMLELIRYVAMNPVRAGLCLWPEDWPWSSYAALIGAAPPPPFLAVNRALELFGSTPAAARKALAAFVRSAPRDVAA